MFQWSLVGKFDKLKNIPSKPQIQEYVKYVSDRMEMLIKAFHMQTYWHWHCV